MMKRRILVLIVALSVMSTSAISPVRAAPAEQQSAEPAAAAPAENAATESTQQQSNAPVPAAVIPTDDGAPDPEDAIAPAAPAVPTEDAGNVPEDATEQQINETTLAAPVERSAVEPAVKSYPDPQVEPFPEAPDPEAKAKAGGAQNVVNAAESEAGAKIEGDSAKSAKPEDEKAKDERTERKASEESAPSESKTEGKAKDSATAEAEDGGTSTSDEASLGGRPEGPDTEEQGIAAEIRQTVGEFLGIDTGEETNTDTYIPYAAPDNGGGGGKGAGWIGALIFLFEYVLEKGLDCLLLGEKCPNIGPGGEPVNPPDEWGCGPNNWRWC